METGIIKRLPTGEFIEVHQPLGGVDDHGHAEAAGVPGRSGAEEDEQAGSAGHPMPGSLLKPDPADETIALERARAEQHAREHADEIAFGEHEQQEHTDRELPVD